MLINASVCIKTIGFFPLVSFRLVVAWSQKRHWGRFLPFAPSSIHLLPTWLSECRPRQCQICEERIIVGIGQSYLVRFFSWVPWMLKTESFPLGAPLLVVGDGHCWEPFKSRRAWVGGMRLYPRGSFNSFSSSWAFHIHFQ